MADQIIDIPGVGPVAFPDSMSQAEITAAAKRLHDQTAATLKRASEGMLPPSDSKRERHYPLSTGIPGVISGIGKGVEQTVAGTGRLIERVTGINLPDIPVDPEARTTAEKIG